MTTVKDARYWIETLKLVPHPEGGYYRETYRSRLLIPKDALPAQFGGARLASTAIYFLLEGKNFSAFHRLRSDEMWHFHAGGPRVRDPGTFALVGCTVAPGFDFEDFELAKRPQFIRRYPQHRELIEQLTRV
jgi:predicted cupin superfamily sugar epimerase